MDKEAFVQQVTAQTGVMYRTAISILHNEEDAKDAIQTAILRAWEKQDSLRKEAMFRSWLVRILINTCISMRRSQRPTVSLEDIPEPVYFDTAPAPDLALALQRVREDLRLPLMLVYVEGMSYDEAAAALHIPGSTLRSRINRGRKALRRELSAS